MSVLSLVLALQHQPLVLTTTPSGDTLGYWQQRADYTITATLDESRSVLRASGTLRYVNHSPETLREVYLHQYLNAFRPGSKWSRSDEAEGRERFQNLSDPHYGYERFLEPPRVAYGADTLGDAVTPEYPGAPDSTVVRLALPRPLRSGDSILVRFVWEARPSTVPRRQGRRGRSYDFAQWYPKVAVFDRRGWEHNPLIPAGEFYGEFGTFDVTLVVPRDQVLGATGVPVEGDPGWAQALRSGTSTAMASAYGTARPGPAVEVPDGFRRVRWVARDVHHFAWSTSPDYRYEGGTYVRPAGAPRMHFRTWDTVALHVLYRPGDEGSWGNGRVIERSRVALRWLESIYGPYAYPQMTVLHRLDGGGTEFPMMQMNGSPSQGLILHEGGHIYTYGILANNEWQSGWMDEGLTSYQTSWAQGATPQDTGRAPRTAPRRPGYAGRAVRPSPTEAQQIGVYRRDLLGGAQPVGTRADQFSEFGIYNEMIYTRAEHMFGSLRDVLGDSTFAAFLRDYYARWALKHVDELAMLASAERVSGRDLDWFFEQWVHGVGLVDYEIRGVDKARAGDGWVTRVRVRRKGEYAHPMPVGALTSGGWTIVRTDPTARDQWVEIRTAERPRLVRLDPRHTTEDWDVRNDWRFDWGDLFRRTESPRIRKSVVDWPFLDQFDREREIIAWSPIAWSSEPRGTMVGLRSRGNYQGWIDASDWGVVFATRRRSLTGRSDDAWPDAVSDVQVWGRWRNPTLPFRRRPLIGGQLDVASLDGIGLLAVRKTWDNSRFVFARSPRVSTWLGLTGSVVLEDSLLPESWSDAQFAELSVGQEVRQHVRGPTTFGTRAEFVAGHWKGDDDASLYGRVTLTGTAVTARREGRDATAARIFIGFGSERSPQQRGVFWVADPLETFFNHWYRPRGALLKGKDVHYVPLGGAGLRGFDPRIAVSRIVAANLEDNTTLFELPGELRTLRVGYSVFADGGFLLAGGFRLFDDWLADAGFGLTLRGRLFDRDVRARVDFPLFVNTPFGDIDPPGPEEGRLRFRYTFSSNDLW